MSVTYHAPKQGAFFALCASMIILLAAPVEAYQNNQRDILLLKILLGLGSTAAGATLLWQHRPSRIDAQVEKLNKREKKMLAQQAQKDKEYRQSVEEVNRAVQERMAQTLEMANERLRQAQADFTQMMEESEREKEALRQQLQQANYPKLPPQTTPANCSCRAIQLALWREGMLFDWDKNEPPAYIYDKGKKLQQYVLEPRNQSHMTKFIKARGEVPHICEYALGEAGSVKITQSGDRIVFKFTPGDTTTKQKEEIELAKKPLS